MGQIGADLGTDFQEDQAVIGEKPSIFKTNDNADYYFEDQEGNNLFRNIIKGYKTLPTWLNSIIFGVLLIILLWIIISSLPTFNGGG